MNKTPLFATLIAAILLLAAAPAYATLIVDTDKNVYQYGDWLNVSGTGAAPNLPVTIQVYNPTGLLIAQRTTSANAQGAYTLANVLRFPTPPLPAHLPLGEYTVKAIDGTGATAQKTIRFAVVDTTPPTIEHTPVTTAPINTPIEIKATVTDNIGVAAVYLSYRVTGTPTFTQLTMTAVGNVYSATIPAAAVTLAGVEYYITAVDTAGNTARAPTTGAYTITVLVAEVRVSPSHAPPGATITYTGTRFTPGRDYTLTIDWSGIIVTLASGKVAADGSISGTFTVPGVQSAVYIVTAKDAAGVAASTRFGVEQVSTKALESKIDALSTQLASVERTLSTKMDTLQTTITSAIASAQKSLSDAITSAQKAVIDAVSTAQNDIKAAIASAQKAVTDALASAQNDIKAAIASAQNDVKAAIASAQKAVTDAISSAQNDIKAAVASAQQALNNAITSAQNDVKNAVASAQSALAGSVKGVEDSVKAAQTALSGSISTIASNVAALRDEVGNINAGVSTASTFVLVVTALAVIILVLELAVLIRRR